jgi:hypothetical protein
MKKYKTTIWPLSIIGLFAILVMIHANYPAEDFWRTTRAFGIWLIPVIGSLVAFGWLTYTKVVDSTELLQVQAAIYRKKAPIAKITHITQEGTYYVLQSIIKSLYVYYTNKDGDERFFHFSMSLYDGKTLQGLLKDLLEINPNIKLDRKTERLLETGSAK